MLNITLQKILSEEWLNQVLENDFYLTDEFIRYDIIIFDGNQVLLDIKKIMCYIENNKILNIFFVVGNFTLH
jgi:hypothetical protein